MSNSTYCLRPDRDPVLIVEVGVDDATKYYLKMGISEWNAIPKNHRRGTNTTVRVVPDAMIQPVQTIGCNLLKELPRVIIRHICQSFLDKTSTLSLRRCNSMIYHEMMHWGNMWKQYVKPGHMVVYTKNTPHKLIGQTIFSTMWQNFNIRLVRDINDYGYFKDSARKASDELEKLRREPTSMSLIFRRKVENGVMKAHRYGKIVKKRTKQFKKSTKDLARYFTKESIERQEKLIWHNTPVPSSIIRWKQEPDKR